MENSNSIQDPICRVCRSTSTPEQPLYHPCKCSGSMKFIHQSCLEEWLSVSSKTKCEICNYTFKFTSIYSLDSENMSILVLLNVMKQRCLKWIPFYLRTLVVVLSWFVLAPLGTFWIYNTQFKTVSQIFKEFVLLLQNVKSWLSVFIATPNPIQGLSTMNMKDMKDILHSLHYIFQHPKMMNFYSTLLHSQLITLYIVLMTICLISLREFILANTSQEELKRYKRNKLMLKSLKMIQSQSLSVEERSKADASTLRLLLQNENTRLELHDLKSIIYYIHVCLEARKAQLSHGDASTTNLHSNKNVAKDYNTIYDLHNQENPIDLKLKQLFALYNHLIVKEKNQSVRTWCEIMIAKKRLEYEELQLLCFNDLQKLQTQEQVQEVLQEALHEVLQEVPEEKEEDEEWEDEKDNVTTNETIKEIILDKDISNQKQKHPSSRHLPSRIPIPSPKKSSSFAFASTTNTSTPIQGSSSNANTNTSTANKEMEELVREWSRLRSVKQDLPESNVEEPLQPPQEVTQEFTQEKVQEHLIVHEEEQEKSHLGEQVQLLDEVQQEEQEIEQAREEIEQEEENGEMPQQIQVQGEAEPEALININIGPDLQIEIEAGNGEMTALMELVGVAGPLSNLFKSLLLYFLIAILILTVLISFPRTSGVFCIWFVRHIYWPVVHSALEWSTIGLQFVTDPVIEPLVDGLLYLFKAVGNHSVLSKSFMSIIGFNLTLIDFNLSSFYTSSVTMNSTNMHATMNSTNMIETILETVLETGNKTVLEQKNQDLKEWHESISFSILLGYIILSSLFTLYLWFKSDLHHPYIKTFLQLISRVVSNMAMAFQFIFFMTLEILVFPCYCGFLIASILLPALNLSLSSLMTFISNHPIICYFLHWIIGAIFMYQTSLYLSFIRTIVRPGVLWFIRDPNDPRFQPALELMQKPFFTLLKRLAHGVFMYSFITLLTFGGFMAPFLLYNHFLKGILVFKYAQAFQVFPLRWDPHDSLYQLPIEILVNHFTIPWMISQMNFKTNFNRFVISWFQWASKSLCLSHFMFGGERRPSEESDLHVERDALDPLDSRNYRFLRVPNHDHVEIIPRVYDLMTPIREHDEVVGREGETPEDVRANWTRVYVPTRFWMRVRFFFLLHQLTLISMSILLFTLPLILGRLTSLFAQELIFLKVESLGTYSSIVLLSARSDLACHDSYSFTLGVFILLTCSCMVKGLRWFISCMTPSLNRRNAIRRRSSRVDVLLPNDEDPGTTSTEEQATPWTSKIKVWWFTLAKPILKKTIAFISLVLWVGILLPILLGFIVTIYILHPLSSPPDYIKPHLILNQWMFGALLLKMIVYLVTLGPENTTRRVLLNVQQRGIHMNILDFYRHLILPLLSLLVSILLLPRAFTLIMESIESRVGDKSSISFYLEYYVLMMGLLSILYLLLKKSMSQLVDRIKEDEFRIGRTLHNYA